ncbi:hypothetical protein JZ751_013401 [Albula glossodonta]|uniref:Nucleoporin-like protein 2 n=1 Tax=Albula glossodonta TaxID=121402 RepID=A0A8T2MZG3_9TELE|nr:hypothetical protein JZ751_013401 [Albula glossodonta]
MSVRREMLERTSAGWRRWRLWELQATTTVKQQSRRWGSSGRDFVQTSSFSKSGTSDWSRGGGGERNIKSSSFSFSNQNRFSALGTQQNYSGGSQGDDHDKEVETIRKDMETWESSGQWPFSCYSAVKASISGFTELSPEELRLEYYSSRAAGDLQNYADSVQQLASRWSSRVSELKNLNSTTRVALIAELNSPPSASLGFSSVSSGFGTGGFGAGGSEGVASSGFGSAVPQAGPGGFGSIPSVASFSFSSQTPMAPSFSTGPAPTAASFSFSSSTPFAQPPADKAAAAGFGASAANFSFSPSGFGVSSATPSSVSGTVFAQPAGGGLSGAGAGSAGGAAVDKLFTPQSELTPEELKQFTEKRFTLGQVPLRPPPAELLVV